MKPIYHRVTLDKRSSNNKKQVWVKTIHIFGIKIGRWEYNLDQDEDDKLGFNSNKDGKE